MRDDPMKPVQYTLVEKREWLTVILLFLLFDFFTVSDACDGK